MIDVLLIIIAILIPLLVNLIAYRMYLRTRLKGYFIIGIGISIGIFGLVGSIIGNEDIFSHVADIGMVLFYIGLVILYILEGGSVREAMSGHSIFEIMRGDISSLSHKKYKPVMTKRTGIIMGILTILAGIVVSFHYPLLELFPVGTILILGLGILVISVFFLPGSKEEDPGSGPHS